VIRVGTRGSALALVQANLVVDALRAGGAAVEVVTIRTEGDRRVDERLAEVGGKGLFVREIEAALLDGQIDVAVHSLKDLPAEVAPGLILAVYLRRDDPRDVLITKRGGGVDALPHAARVGTSSPRRRALLLAARPDLRVEPLRGNVDSRLRRLESGDWDGIVLAAAGVRRLGLTLSYAEPLSPDVFVPAVGQGVIAIEARAADAATLAAVTPIDDPDTRACVIAERAYLARLGASCVTPMGAYAELRGGDVTLSGVVANDDGRAMLRASATGPRAEAALTGRRLAETLLARGAAAITPLAPRVA
jgi:hydroxymethylbilane synthase